MPFDKLSFSFHSPLRHVSKSEPGQITYLVPVSPTGSWRGRQTQDGGVESLDTWYPLVFRKGDAELREVSAKNEETRPILELLHFPMLTGRLRNPEANASRGRFKLLVSECSLWARECL